MGAGDGAMAMMPGYRDLDTIQPKQQAASKPVQPPPRIPVSTPIKQEVIAPKKQEVIQPKKPSIVLPKKDTAVLYQEKIEKDNSLPQLIKQIEKGCGDASCQNSNCCLTANKGLHEALQIPKPDKTAVIQAALRMQIEDKYKICEK